MQDGPAHTPFDLTSHSPRLVSSEDASTLTLPPLPIIPRWWLAPGRWTHNDRPGTPGTLQKKTLQLGGPHTVTSSLLVNVALDPGSLKLPTKFMNRGGVAFSLPIPISLHASSHTHTHTLAWCRLLLDCPPSCYVGLQGQISISIAPAPICIACAAAALQPAFSSLPSPEKHRKSLWEPQEKAQLWSFSTWTEARHRPTFQGSKVPRYRCEKRTSATAHCPTHMCPTCLRPTVALSLWD